MKIIRLKSSIRAKTDLDNIIEDAKIIPLDSSIFENYVNFITVNITSEYGRQTIFKSNHYRQVFDAFYNSYNALNGRESGKSR